MIKKHFVIVLENNSSNVIDHIAVSDLPLMDNMVGLPDRYNITHKLHRYEFDADTGTSSILRAREVLAEIEVRSGLIKIKSGRNKLSNLKIGRKRIK